MSHDRQRLKRRARRRAAVLRPDVLTSSLLASLLMLDILRANGLTVLETMSLVLFFVLFTWITGAFWTAIAGFIIRLAGGDPAVMQAHDARRAGRSTAASRSSCRCTTRTPRRVTAGLDVIWSSLAKQAESAALRSVHPVGHAQARRSRRPRRLAWRALVARQGGQGRIFYRRRAQNIGRKAGNIADFVRTWGGAYSHMLVLDADSVMSGKALVTLARLMDAHPEVGHHPDGAAAGGPRDAVRANHSVRRPPERPDALQRPGVLAARRRQLLGPQCHPAAATVRARTAICRACRARRRWAARSSATISSRPPSCGAPGSRSGWCPISMGSWEEVPSNIIDFAARDRRWAQGNLQHWVLMHAAGCTG